MYLNDATKRDVLESILNHAPTPPATTTITTNHGTVVVNVYLTPPTTTGYPNQASQPA